MKAFLIDRYGKNHGRLGEVPDINDVLVKVHASSVNLLDSLVHGRLLVPGHDQLPPDHAY